MSTSKSRECVNVALFAKGLFGDVIKNLERRPSQVTQVCHKPNDRCPSRRQDEMTQTGRGQGHVKIKAEIGMTQPQVNKCQEPPEEEAASLVEPSEGGWHLAFRPLASRTVRQEIPHV